MITSGLCESFWTLYSALTIAQGTPFFPVLTANHIFMLFKTPHCFPVCSLHSPGPPRIAHNEGRPCDTAPAFLPGLPLWLLSPTNALTIAVPGIHSASLFHAFAHTVSSAWVPSLSSSSACLYHFRSGLKITFPEKKSFLCAGVVSYTYSKVVIMLCFMAYLLFSPASLNTYRWRMCRNNLCLSCALAQRWMLSMHSVFVSIHIQWINA